MSDKQSDPGSRGYSSSFMVGLVYRFLFRSRSIGVLPWLTVFALSSVAVGVATLIVALSVFNGFSSAVRNQITSVYSPVRVYPGQSQYLSISKTKKKLSNWVSGEKVIGVHEENVLFKGEGGNYEGGRVTSYTDWVPGRLNAQSIPDTGVLLGKELARRLSVYPGGRITLIRPSAQQTPFGTLPGGKTLPVEDLLETGYRQLNRYLAIIPWNSAREIFNLPKGKASYLEVWLDNYSRADTLKKRIQKKYPDEFFILTWKEANPAMFEALNLERTVMFIVLTLIVLVAAINILSMLVLSILQRRQQIATMMAMGAGPRTILGLFLLAGMSITFCGLVVGFILGLGGCYLLANVFVIELPPVYPMNTLPIEVEPNYLFLIAAVTLALGFLSSFYPAWKASRIDPAEVLRNA